MANSKIDDSDTLCNRELEFCYQFTTHFFTTSDVSKEFDAGGKTKVKAGHKSEIMGMSGYAAGSTAGETLGAFLPHPLSNVPGKVLAKAGNTLFKKIAIVQLTKEQREKHKKIHDVVENEHLNFDKFMTTCILASLSIFRDYECQFKKVTRKEKDGQKSWKRAMSKLAEEATERCFNYITKLTPAERDIFSESFKDPLVGPISIKKAVVSGKCKQSMLNKLRGKKGHKLRTYQDIGNEIKKELKTTTADFFDKVQQDKAIRESTAVESCSVQEIFDYIIERYEKFCNKQIQRIHNGQLRELINLLKSNVSEKNGLRKLEVFHNYGSLEPISDTLEPITYGNPMQIDRFLKRESLIKEARKARESGLRVIVFSGPLGTGKTQEAIHYVIEERDNCQVDIIFLQSETIESLNVGLRDFANSYLGMPRDSQNTYLFELIVAKLKRRKAVFILDNVTEESVLLKIPIIAMPVSHRVLVTTQLDNLYCEKYFIIRVKEFGSDLTERFFKEHLININANHTDIKHLIKEIGTIPIYVQLTCSFLNDGVRNNGNYSIREFLSQLDRQLIPEYFKGTVDSAHFVNPIGGPKRVWAMALEKVKADETVGELALEILTVIAYLRPDHVTEEFVMNVLGSPNHYERALRLLTRFHIIGIRTVGLTRFISIYPMVQATIRNLDQNEENEAPLGNILNLFIQIDMENRKECKHTEGLFLPPHFHTVFKYAICNESSFSKFEGKLLDLWRSPAYVGTYDKLFQLEILLSFLEKVLTKSNISDWLEPFNRRHRALGIEDLGINSEINGSSCDDLYDRVFSLLDTNGHGIQIEVVKFTLNRAHYTWCNSREDLAVKMYKDAYVVALYNCKFKEPELQVLQSIFYIGSQRRIFYTDFFKLIYKAESNEHFEYIFERLSKYYQIYYDPSKKYITVFPGALLGAKSHLENIGQDVPTLIYIAIIFRNSLDKEKFQLCYSKYLESILCNLNNERYSSNTDLQNLKTELEAKYNKYMETKTSQYRRANILFEQLTEYVIKREDTCEHDLGNEQGDESDSTGTSSGLSTRRDLRRDKMIRCDTRRYDLRPDDMRRDDKRRYMRRDETTGDRFLSSRLDRLSRRDEPWEPRPMSSSWEPYTPFPIRLDGAIPPKEAKPIILDIVRIMNAEIPCSFALHMIAHLDVGMGACRHRTDPIINHCDFLKPPTEEMLEDLEKYRFVCSFQRSPTETMYRRIEDTRPQYIFNFPPYLRNNAYTLAYSWVMSQIRLDCEADAAKILRHILLGLKSLGNLSVNVDDKLYYMKLFRNIWTRVIQGGHNQLLIEFSELLSWSMYKCFEKDCSSFFNMGLRKRVTGFSRDTILSTIRLLGMNRGVFVNKETRNEKFILIVLKALDEKYYKEFTNESRLIEWMRKFEESCSDYGFRELDSIEYENRHKAPWIDSVHELLFELENKE